MDNNNMYNNDNSGQQPVYPQTPVEPQGAQPVYQQEPIEPQGAQPVYQQEPQMNYQQMPPQPGMYSPIPQEPAGPELEEPVSLGEWMIAMLLMCIPCVNIVLMFVWAFSKSEKKSKSNYFKASLIWMAIGLGVMILFWIVMAIGIISAVS